MRVPGASITEDVGAGDPLVPGQEQLFSIPATTSRLTRIRLRAATYLHPSLDGFLNVRILTPGGDLLREVVISGEHVKDLVWFPIDFEPIEEDYPGFVIGISGDYEAGTPFSLWEDEEGRVLYEIFYAFDDPPY